MHSVNPSFQYICCNLFKIVLEDQGYSVSTADTTAKGLAYIILNDFDLIFLYLNMPGTDDAEIFREMKEIKDRLPVVIITANPENEMMERATKYDPISVLIKPFSEVEIVNTVDSILSSVPIRS